LPASVGSPVRLACILAGALWILGLFDVSMTNYNTDF
jgi:hypothetical protein